MLVVGVPLYQLAVLQPAGYVDALTSPQATLRWIAAHLPLFLGYRALLMIGFVLMLGLPFALFRIIVAQEILGRDDEDEEEEDDDEQDAEEAKKQAPGDAPAGNVVAGAQDSAGDAGEAGEVGALPEFAWRGHGFAVLAAWLGLAGLVVFPLATLASTIYYAASSSGASGVASASAPLTGLFAVLTFTAGGGLLAVSSLFFGAVITRSGRRLWPDSWLAFGYVGLALAALLSASAVEVALAPGAGQAVLSTPAILLFALWVGWFGAIVARLKQE